MSDEGKRTLSAIEKAIVAVTAELDRAESDRSRAMSAIERYEKQLSDLRGEFDRAIAAFREKYEFPSVTR